MTTNQIEKMVTVNATSGTKKLNLYLVGRGVKVVLNDSTIVVGAQDLEDAVNDLLWGDDACDGPEEFGGNLSHVSVTPVVL